MNEYSKLSDQIDNICSQYKKIDLEQFSFLKPPSMIDSDLKLELINQKPYDKENEYVPTYEFNIVNNYSNAIMGGFRLRIGYNEIIKYLGHLGANVDEEYRGNQYTTRSIKLMLPFVAQHGLDDLIVTCNPDNIASIKTCERAGGIFLGITNIPETNVLYSKESTQKRIYHFKL